MCGVSFSRKGSVQILALKPVQGSTSGKDSPSRHFGGWQFVAPFYVLCNLYFFGGYNFLIRGGYCIQDDSLSFTVSGLRFSVHEKRVSCLWLTLHLFHNNSGSGIFSVRNCNGFNFPVCAFRLKVSLLCNGFQALRFLCPVNRS